MTGALLGLRTGSYGSLLPQQQQQHAHDGAVLPVQTPPGGGGRKNPKMFPSGCKEKEKFLPQICKPCLPIRVGMLLVVTASLGALMITMTGFRRVGDVSEIPGTNGVSPFPQVRRFFEASTPPISSFTSQSDKRSMEELSPEKSSINVGENKSQSLVPIIYKSPPSRHPCEDFSFPPPPADKKRTGPRPCPVCYIPVEDAIALMPTAPSVSPILKNLTYASEEGSVVNESRAGSQFGGHPSMEQRNESFNIKKSMTVHCGFVNGNRPGNGTGFDIDVADLLEMEQCHGVVVASAIFGNYDLLQQPRNISEFAKKTVCFYMFVDEETEAYLKNSSTWDSSSDRVGLWRMVVVRNLPYVDPRRTGKVPKLLLHRMFPNARFSLWIDGKLELVVDPYQILERFLWRKNATFAISRHYKRFDVFDEAEANKAAGKYDNTSIDYQIEVYKSEGLTHYSSAKLPITSDVPEGCVIVREHIPISNLFTCLWFNEVDRFTSRDQISFSTVRDKIMSKTNWTVAMFMDCERRNFVVQGYHRDVLEQKKVPATTAGRPPPPRLPSKERSPPQTPLDGAGDTLEKKAPAKIPSLRTSG